MIKAVLTAKLAGRGRGFGCYLRLHAPASKRKATPSFSGLLNYLTLRYRSHKNGNAMNEKRNKSLNSARDTKQDEFYTQLSEIEN